MHKNTKGTVYKTYSGVSKEGLRVLEHPPQLWHNSQISLAQWQLLYMLIIDYW